MFEYLKGEIIKITPSFLVLEVQGIGFRILMPNPYIFANSVGSKVKLFIQQVIREDSHTLYGFKTEFEKNIFLKLISVSGIGPKSALAILAKEDYEGIVQAINNADVKYLTRFPGVGKKIAQQIIIDLQGKLTAFIDNCPTMLKSTVPVSENSPYLNEAIEALGALGYAKKDINRVKKDLGKDKDLTTEEYLRKALKIL